MSPPMHLGSIFYRQPACLCPAGQSKASGMSRVVPQPVDTSTVPFRPRQATFAHQRTPRNGSGNGPTPRSGKKLTGPQSTFERGPITQPRPTYFGPGGPVHRAYDRPWTQGFLFLLLFLALFMLDIFKVCLAAKSHDDGQEVHLRPEYPLLLGVWGELLSLTEFRRRHPG